MRRRRLLWRTYLFISLVLVITVLFLPGLGRGIGIALIVVALGVIAWSVRQRQIEGRRWAAIGSFYSLTPERFEQHVASTFGYLGYATTTTPRVGDQGVDIIAHKAGEALAIQVKRYADKAPNSAVQAVHTGAVYYGCNRAVLVCLGGFSKAAIEVAATTSVELVDGRAYADIVHRIAPIAQAPSIWLPRGLTLAAAASLMVVGIAAILFAGTWTTVLPHLPSSATATRHRPAPLFVLALALIAIGLFSIRGGRRRQRR